MVIISNFSLVFNSEKRIYQVESHEVSTCPVCRRTLRHKDRRKRIMRKYNGDLSRILISRLKCTKCKRIHTELPDILTPHKHYSTEIIENVVDEVSTPEDLTTEDFPCEKTMARWKKWIQINQTQIDGQLKVIGSTFPGIGKGLLKSKESLLERLRASGSDWLAKINRAIYNAGGRIAPLPLRGADQICLVSLLSFEVSCLQAKQEVNKPHECTQNQQDKGLAGRKGTASARDHPSSAGRGTGPGKANRPAKGHRRRK